MLWEKIKRNHGFILYGTILALLILSGINPHDAFTWRLEVLWMFPALFIIALMWGMGVRFSWVLKMVMFLQALILIYGGYYTYGLAPAGEWMKEAFGFTRNNYDRFAHLTQGIFPAFLYREMFVRCKALNGKFWTEIFVFASCVAFSAVFELIEFAAAHIWGNGADAFLATQGDIWDAQYDIFMCLIGVLISIVLFSRAHYKVIEKMHR
jgi:putative membrane protein